MDRNISFTITALIIFYLVPDINYSYYFCIGISLFIVSLLHSALSGLHYQIKKLVFAGFYKDLAYTDSLTGLFNRNAFELTKKESAPDPGFAVQDAQKYSYTELFKKADTQMYIRKRQMKATDNQASL